MSERLVLMCSPKYYRVAHKINPQTDLKIQAKEQLATEQWQNLKDQLEFLGQKIKVVQGAKDWPDMVFTANAALITGEKEAVIALFKYPERQGEVKYFRRWFDERGWKTYQPNAFFEGAGEAFFWKNKLLLGVGQRSNFDTKYALAKFIKDIPILDLYLTQEYFYHLDLALTPIPAKDLIAYYPGAFNQESLRKIRYLDADFLEVSREDAYVFGCNAIPVGDNIIINKKAQKLADQYQKKGLNPIFVDTSEFEKMGGSARCLTLDLHYAGSKPPPSCF